MIIATSVTGPGLTLGFELFAAFALPIDPHKVGSKQ
jgi:hypothetical protein